MNPVSDTIAQMGVIKCGIFVVMLSACGTEKISQCKTDSDCKDIAYPFCDVDGQYGPSGGEHNVCTVTPSDCPVDRCGCSPGATTCDGDQLTVCDAGGMSQSTSTCTVGCSSSKDRCASFEPSNGLGPAMESGVTATAVTIADGSKVDTSSGAVMNALGVSTPVQSVLLTQTGGPDIRAFYAASFDIGSVTVTGTKAIAFVAPGKITMHGSFDASAKAPTNGPGATLMAIPCRGQSGSVGGGGGNATSGAQGSYLNYSASTTTVVQGGVAQANYAPLIGGCAGGGGGVNSGGGGGGALQLVSRDSVSLANVTLNLGGGGGASSAGGGAGGTLIVEAPIVSMSGTIAANGGAGGGCGVPGEDATTNDTPATGGFDGSSGPGKCFGHGGNGGTRSMAPVSGPSEQIRDGGGGGGGSVGRMIVRTRDGSYDSTALASEIVGESEMLEIE